MFCIHEKDHPFYEEIINGRFKRTERGSDNKVINISLADFLQRDILKEYLSAELTYFIEPQSHISLFYHDKFGTRKNCYSAGNYSISLSQFIENIFAAEANPYDIWAFDSDGGLTELQNAEKALAQHKIEVSPEVTLLWLNYIYIKDEYNKISKEKYRDFIELSSPLDYMGDS